jgi:DNA-directed RNA polymerase subunit RPC12/RpoP
MASGTPRPYEIDGRPLTCPHCAHNAFHTRRTLLNTRGLAFLQWDWLNRDAANYICARCGQMQWFVDLPR